MKKCVSCTAEIQDDEKFCSYCGKEQESQIVDNNQNQMPMVNNYNQYPNNEKKSKVLYILLIVTIVICMGACFLPFFSIGDYSINYIYNESLSSLSKSGGVADGVFVITFGIISILTIAIGKKRIPAIIFQSLSCAVFFYDYFNGQDSGLLSQYYAIGFYLLFVFLIVSVVLAILRLILKNKFD